MQKKSIKDIDVKGKRVLMRADFNVPLDENGGITDDIRIKSSLPTIEYILNQNATLEFDSLLASDPNLAQRWREAMDPDSATTGSSLINQGFVIPLFKSFTEF